MELHLHDDPAASLNTAKRQVTRSRVSYRSVTTQQHLYLLRLHRLEHYGTPCDRAHFKYAQSTRLRSDK